MAYTVTIIHQERGDTIMSGKDKIAVCHRTALKMFYDAGWRSVTQLMKANDILKGVKPATEGYFYADDVSRLISQNNA